MSRVLKELRENPLNWLLVFVPGVFVAEQLRPESHTALFLLSVAAIIPLGITVLPCSSASMSSAEIRVNAPEDGSRSVT